MEATLQGSGLRKTETCKRVFGEGDLASTGGWLIKKGTTRRKTMLKMKWKYLTEKNEEDTPVTKRKETRDLIRDPPQEGEEESKKPLEGT